MTPVFSSGSMAPKSKAALLFYDSLFGLQTTEQRLSLVYWCMSAVVLKSK
jgi:hypothetical protein